jgi:ABC-2 type transport system permease protein
MALEVMKQAIKDKAMGALVVTVLLFFYVFWIATFFPQLKDSLGLYDEMLKNPTIQAIIGSEVTSMGTFTGYMAMEVFSYMGLVLGAYIVFVTASFVAGEIEQKCSELMLSLPVSREHVLLSRFAVLVPVIALVTLAMLAAIYAGGWFIGETTEIGWFGYAMLFTGAFLLAAGALSLFVSALMSDGRKAALLSTGILLAMFLVENIGSMVTSIDWARRLSLFHYSKVASIVLNHEVSWTNLGLLLLVAIVFLALAVIAFRRRDVNVN